MDQSFSLQDLYEDRLETQRISTRFLNRYDVELWAKGYHKRIIGLELTPENYSSNFHWVKNWILIHFFYKSTRKLDRQRPGRPTRQRSGASRVAHL